MKELGLEPFTLDVEKYSPDNGDPDRCWRLVGFFVKKPDLEFYKYRRFVPVVYNDVPEFLECIKEYGDGRLEINIYIESDPETKQQRLCFELTDDKHVIKGKIVPTSNMAPNGSS
jgi:hypothetical protein